jgi:hypothetical protein
MQCITALADDFILAHSQRKFTKLQISFTVCQSVRNNSRTANHMRGADKCLALKRKQQVTGLKKCIYSTYSPRAPHTYDFVVLTSLTHSRNILLVVLQIEK